MPRVEIIRARLSEADDELDGVVWLDERGVVVADEGARWMVDDPLYVWTPERGMVGPEAGDAWLRALPGEFSSGYLYAVYLADDEQRPGRGHVEERAPVAYPLRLPNGKLLVPARAEGPDGLVGDGVNEIAPDDPEFAAWSAVIDRRLA